MCDRRYREESFLRHRYVERRQSASEIAADCGGTSSTVSRWLDHHDIDREPRYKDCEWLRRQYVDAAADRRISPPTVA